jgi:hypothetical protein
MRLKKNNFYVTPNVIKVIKSRRMKRTGHVRNAMEDKCVNDETLRTHRWEDNINVV